MGRVEQLSPFIWGSFVVICVPVGLAVSCKGSSLVAHSLLLGLGLEDQFCSLLFQGSAVIVSESEDYGVKTL